NFWAAISTERPVTLKFRVAGCTIAWMRPSLPVSRSPTMSDIDVLLQENRKFAPPDEFRRQVHVSSDELYTNAERDPERFWAEMAGSLEWSRPWDKVLEW